MSIELAKKGLEAGARSNGISNWAIDVLNSIENEKQKGKKRDGLSRIKPFLRGLAGLPSENKQLGSNKKRLPYLDEVYTPETKAYLLGEKIGRALGLADALGRNGKTKRITVGVVGIEGMNCEPWGDSPDDQRHLKEIRRIIGEDYKKGVSRILNLLLSSYQQERKVDPQALSRELGNLQRAVNKIVSHREKLSTEGGRGIAHFATPEEEKDGKRNSRRVILAASAVSSVLSGCVPLSQPPAMVEKSTTPIYQNHSQETSSAVIPPDITTVTPTVTVEIPTPIPTSTPTPTSIPTPTETPTPVDWHLITPEERFRLAPETYTAEDGQTFKKGSVSTINPELIIYRDEEGFAWYVYDGNEFKRPWEGGIIEVVYVEEDGALRREEFPAFLIPETLNEEDKMEACVEAFTRLVEYAIKVDGTPLETFPSISFYDRWKQKHITGDYENGPSYYFSVLLSSANLIDRTGGSSIPVYDQKGEKLGNFILSFFCGVKDNKQYPFYPDNFVFIVYPNSQIKPEGSFDSSYESLAFLVGVSGEDLYSLLDYLSFKRVGNQIGGVFVSLHRIRYIFDIDF